MGIGHRVYKVKDARATVLQELAEHIFAESSRPKNYETALELERICAGIYGPKGIYPNVDFYSGVVYQALGIPTDVFTPIFAIARVAGLAGPLARAARRQPHLPPGADLRRQDRPEVRAARRETVSRSDIAHAGLRYHGRCAKGRGGIKGRPNGHPRFGTQSRSA